VIDVLPEYKPTQPDENLEKLTVYHLLTMTAGKDVPTLSDKSKNRWVRDFFDAKWALAPGEFWRYISENQYMLCVMLTRVTGMSVSEYLRPRLYKPLGFEGVPFWERDGNGIETGGWGMKMTTEELAKITLCYQQGGKFNGKQIIPAWWAKEAVKKQVENLQYSDLASASGYGYCFWRNPVENSYRADGLFSQFGMVFEDYDACLIMTASEIFETKARDCVWRHFPGMFTKKGKKTDTVQLPSLKPMDVLPVHLAAAKRVPLTARY
jgi:CubicO group peptidase (beta-lactamase class C family)